MRVHDYHQGNRQLQDRFGTRKLADRLTERVTETISPEGREIIESASMFFLATCDGRGLPTCSYKGGRPIGGIRIRARQQSRDHELSPAEICRKTFLLRR